MSILLWIQTVWHSGGIPKRNFEKINFEKKQTTKKHEKNTQHVVLKDY